MKPNTGAERIYIGVTGKEFKEILIIQFAVIQTQKIQRKHHIVKISL